MKGYSNAGLVVIGDTDWVRDDVGQRQAFSSERVLEFDTGDLSGFVAGRASYSQLMVPLSQPEFDRTDGYAILEAESQKTERPFSDHFVLLGPIAIQADDD